MDVQSLEAAAEAMCPGCRDAKNGIGGVRRARRLACGPGWWHDWLEATPPQKGFVCDAGPIRDLIEQESAMNEQSEPQQMGEQVPLGPCCHCEKIGPTVRNVVMLAQRAPVPGTGWGCFQCGLPQDGAIAVLCDECLEASLPVLFACVGRPGEGKRMPIEGLTDEVFDHDLSQHPEVTYAD